MFKKNLSLLLAGILTISCLTAGCGNNSGNGGESAAAGNGDSQAAATETGKADKAASGEVITLTFLIKIREMPSITRWLRPLRKNRN